MSPAAEPIVGGGSRAAGYGTELRPGTTRGHESHAARLHRIEGQVRGIERMLVEERECIDVLAQIAAPRTALERLALQVLDAHVDRCLADALATGDPEVIEARRGELLGAVERFVRTR